MEKIEAPIVAARPQDITRLRRLLTHGRRVYCNTGDEDLAGLLERHLVLLGEQGGRLWGGVGVELEPRPAALPPHAPGRAYLRLLALTAGYAPIPDGVRLLTAAVDRLRTYSHATLAIAYADEPWLAEALAAAGFSSTDIIQTFHLDVRELPASLLTERTATAVLRPMRPGELDAVAQLDAVAFEPLWHFGRRALWELFFSSHMQVALIEDEIVGYAALAQTGGEAHLTRLAVHPKVQGWGIGRRLLVSALLYAQRHHVHTVSLNTQASNHRSQRFYRSLGFAPTQQQTPVYTLEIAGQRAANGDPSP
jgi:ribosomal-protein-alanine N-acetyltransferase